MGGVGAIEHVRLLMACAGGQQGRCPAVGNHVGRGIAGAEDVLKVMSVGQSSIGCARGGEVAHLRGDGCVVVADGIDIGLIADAGVQTTESGSRAGGGGNGAGAGRKAARAVLNQIAGSIGAARPADDGRGAGHTAGSHFADIGAVGDVFHHNVVDEAVVVGKGIPEGDVSAGVADAVQRIDDIGVGRGVVVRTHQRVDDMDRIDGSCRSRQHAHDEAYAVAALHKVEAYLQLVERCTHFGHN